jgi:hypothetical protein
VTTFTAKQWEIGRNLLDRPEDFDWLVGRITSAGPAVTALLINLGVL